jgi:hypothetical protein
MADIHTHRRLLAPAEAVARLRISVTLPWFDALRRCWRCCV